MTGWRETTLGELIELQRGYDLTEQQRRSGSVPVVGSAGVHGFHDTARSPGPGVTVGRSGASIGVVTFVAEDYWPHNTVLFVRDFRGNDPRYIAALLSGLDLARLNSGSAQPSLNRNFVYPQVVRVPPLRVQVRIGEILSAYDDLVSANRRRVSILQTMASSTFEEWFTRCRYPGYEGDEFRPTPWGSTPAKWSVAKAASLMSYVGGGTPSKSDDTFWDAGSINWFTPSDLTGGETLFLEDSGLQITDTGLAGSSARLFPPFSIMMTSRATLGVFGINSTPACTNQGFITFLPSERLPLYFLYHLLRSEFPRMEAVSSGTTFKEITKGALGRLDFLVPDSDTISRFEALVSPIMQQVQNLGRQNAMLCRARNLLRPKLISGAIDVANAGVKEAA